MKYGVYAPTVPAYIADESSQVVTVEPAATSTQSVDFTYTANDYLVVKNWGTGALNTFTQYEMANHASKEQIPASLEEVQGLVASGEAAEVKEDSIDPVTAEFTIPLPTRLLFVDTRVTPNAYGYTDLNLYRYTGSYAYRLAGVDVGQLENVVVTHAPRGTMSLFTGAAAAKCFVAYMDSHSKSCPNNTAENKRFAWVYGQPKLVDEYDGDVQAERAARVDVNAPVVKAIRVRTVKGAKSATLRRGRAVRLVAKTVPAKTIEKITWKSSRPGIASINKAGKVVAKRAGRTTITAKSTFGKKATFKVRVVRK